MNNFGETLRNLRIARDMGLRETAAQGGISPAYLSRIERGKERPPKPEVIKNLAKVLAADPDVLFRLSASTDPEISELMNENPKVLEFIRLIHRSDPTEEQLDRIIDFAREILGRRTSGQET